MGWRTIVIGESVSFLSLKDKQLIIQLKKQEKQSLPLEDINLIIIETNLASITTALLSAFSKNKISVIICDDKHLPSAFLLPYYQHSHLNSIIQLQIESSLPFKKRIWQKIIKAKIKNQAKCLQLLTIDAHKELSKFIEAVKPGDSLMIEAKTSAFYWKKLFGKQFKRLTYYDKEKDFINSLLNYSYSILRAIIARSIVNHGLLANIGVNHHNKYNSFNLADDLIEPYRAFIDYYVKKNFSLYKHLDNLQSEDKKFILNFITTYQVKINNLRENFYNSVEEMLNSYVQALKNKDYKLLKLPSF